MKKELKVALLQTELVWEDAEANRKMFDKSFSRISGTPDLIVLPEMFNTGFTMDAADVSETMEEKTVTWLIARSKELNTAICGSIIIKEGLKFYNRFLWAVSGELTTYYDKRHLFRMADEHHVFFSGKNRPEINYKSWRIMPRVCYDLRFPVWSRSNKFDLQIYVANWPKPRIAAWDKLLMARAIENQCYVIGVNRIGNDGKGVEYNGHSVIIDPRGDAITPLRSDEKEWIYATLDLESLEDFRAKFPVYMDADQFNLET